MEPSRLAQQQSQQRLRSTARIGGAWFRLHRRALFWSRWRDSFVLGVIQRVNEPRIPIRRVDRQRAGASVSVRRRARLFAVAVRDPVPARAAISVVRWPGNCVPPFGGIPEQVLFDNARALVDHHDAATRTAGFTPPPAGVCPLCDRAYASYRARTRDTDGRGSYVKSNTMP